MVGHVVTQLLEDKNEDCWQAVQLDEDVHEEHNEGQTTQFNESKYVPLGQLSKHWLL